MGVEPGIQLFLDCSGGQVKVLRAAHVDRVPGLSLRRLPLDEQAVRTPRRGLDHLTVALLGETGDVVDSLELPPKGSRYADWFDPKTGHITGGPRDVRPDEIDLRSVRLPLRDHANWIFFHGAQTSGIGTESRLRRRPLGLFRVRPSFALPHAPRLPFDLVAPPVQNLRWAPTRLALRTLTESTPPPDFPGLAEDFQTTDGEIVSVENPVSHGDPAERFDIVITGDGFQRRDMKKFDELAARLIRGLSTMQPFRSVGHLINWHVVRAASKDSGVEHCPTSQPKDTFYQTEGCWDSAPNRAYLGTGEEGLRRIWWAAGKAAPIEHIDLVIVIANCRWYGGHGLPGAKLVIVPACYSRPRLFVPMVAHECGHAILALADEYICGGPEDPDRADPNKARIADVQASLQRRLLERMSSAAQGAVTRSVVPDAVWWRDLHHSNELRKDGTFRAVHAPGDARAGRESPRPRMKPASLEKLLGVFWGCQDTQAPGDLWNSYRNLVGQPPDGSAAQQELQESLGLSRDVTDCEATWWTPGSAGYFRPMAVCRMRQVTYEFCRVCSHLLRNAIKDVCGEATAPPFPPRL